MRYPEIIGQERLKESLTRAFIGGHLPHAMLFLGPPGSQKRDMARAFSRTLLCDRPGEQYCGECDACRLFDSGNHPDFFCLKPRGKLRQIKNRDVTDLIRFFNLKSYRGGRKVILVEDADRLPVLVSNKLLKSLEEPPPETLFILTCPAESGLLPTIVSRCRVIEFPPLPLDCLKGWLKTQSGLPLDEDILARLSGGRIGNLRGLELERLVEDRETVFALVEDWLGRGKLGVIDGCERILGMLDAEKKRSEREIEKEIRTLKEQPADFVKKKEGELTGDLSGLLKHRLDALLQVLCDFFRDVMLVKMDIGRDNLVHADQMPLIRESAERLSNLDGKLRYLDRMRRRLQGTVNQKLALETLLLELFA
jgi:DNA polymerase-3 subunit delta'